MDNQDAIAPAIKVDEDGEFVGFENQEEKEA